MKREKHIAAIVDKTDTSKLLSILRKRELVVNCCQIDRNEDYVFVPISKKISSKEFDINFDCKEHYFEIKKKRPKSLSEALKKLVPEIDEDIIQTSFDQIGDLAVIDIKDKLLPYEKEVGKALMWSNPSIQGVFRKSSKVDGKLRLRELKHIAGTERTTTIHKEHGLRIHLDISEVYFSPRLATEHARVAELIENNWKVLDLFSAVGVFGLHICKNKNVDMISVDINRKAIKLANKSIDDNALIGDHKTKLADATEFIQQCIMNNEKFDAVIMNHPSDAISYLDDVVSIVKDHGQIFYYDFAPIESYEKYSQNLVSNYSNLEIINTHIVRQSSPHEYHICIQFRKLSDQIAHQ